MGEHTINLPPGFRFFPSDEELITHFLSPKSAHQPCQPNIVPTIDLHRFDPWDLDGKALQVDGQWYFFTLDTQHRASSNGYWDPVGPDEPVITSSGGDRVGTKRTLVFYVGEVKTNWAMHEYHLVIHGVGGGSSNANTRSSSKKRGNSRTDSRKWVICRVYETNYSCGSQEDDRELSCMDEVFLSLDDYDEVSLPY